MYRFDKMSKHGVELLDSLHHFSIQDNINNTVKA